jgi:hypothetical protein
MRICGIGFAALCLVLGWQLFGVMALAGAVEDQESGRQHEAGSAKKKSHNASESKRRGLGGARRKAWEVELHCELKAVFAVLL